MPSKLVTMRILAASQRQFLWALLISLGTHLLLALILPGLPMGDFVSPQKSYAEVRLVYIPPKPVEAIKKTGTGPKAKTALPEEGNLLSEQINKLSRAMQFQGTIPAVQLPAEVPEGELSGLLPEVEFPLEEIVLPAGPPLVSTPLVSTPAPREENSPFPPLGRLGSKTHKLPSPIGIEWAGPPRRSLFQPTIPEYSSKVEGEVRLKFWVDPAGKVNNVIVLQKLDADLERISLQYMKQWVFEPLMPGVEQRLQWGTITLRFRRE